MPGRKAARLPAAVNAADGGPAGRALARSELVRELPDLLVWPRARPRRHQGRTTHAASCVPHGGVRRARAGEAVGTVGVRVTGPAAQPAVHVHPDLDVR